MSGESFPEPEDLNRSEKVKAFLVDFARAFFDIPSNPKLDAVGYRKRGVSQLEDFANDSTNPNNT